MNKITLTPDQAAFVDIVNEYFSKPETITRKQIKELMEKKLIPEVKYPGQWLIKDPTFRAEKRSEFKVPTNYVVETPKRGRKPSIKVAAQETVDSSLGLSS